MTASSNAFRRTLAVPGLTALLALMAGCSTPAAPPSSPGPNPNLTPSPGSSMVMCAMDAKQCPNGEWVGRKPPDCQFVCPGAAPAAPR